MSQSWIIASGKGGVGKSMVTAALGIALARRKLQCCCVDADIGLRNVDMLLGMQNKVVYDVLDVARKDCKLKYALVKHPMYETFSLLPAAQLGGVGDMDAEDVQRIVHKLKKRVAYVLLDAPAGIERGVQNLVPASDHCLLVTTADDIAIRDAERVVALLEASHKPRPMLVVNRVIPELVATGDMYSPQQVANTLDLPLLGYVPEDRAVIAAINRHESFMEIACPARDAMERICQRFLGEYVPMPAFKQKRSFFRRVSSGGTGVAGSGMLG
ncbi:MAG: septum site-determining protein MinD [Clostridia bacterium]